MFEWSFLHLYILQGKRKAIFKGDFSGEDGGTLIQKTYKCSSDQMAGSILYSLRPYIIIPGILRPTNNIKSTLIMLRHLLANVNA